MPRVDAPLPATFGKVGAKSWSVAGLMNCYLQPSEGETKTPTVIRPASGLKLRAQPNNGEIRGVIAWKGYPYWVAGDALYKMDRSYSLTAATGDSMAGVGPVSMTANTTQIAIVEQSTTDMFVASGEPQTIAIVNDADFQGAKSIDTLDGIGIFEIPDGDEFGITSVDDYTTISALDFAAAERNPDFNVRVIVDHAELLVCGERTIEPFQNVGGSFPFRRIPGAFIERGLAARFGIVKEDNTIFWIGDDGIFYRAVDYTPQRISNHAVEEQLQGQIISDAEATVWTERGAKFACWRFPTLGKTFVHDISTGLWHQRASGDTSTGLWKGRFSVSIWGCTFIGGLDGNIYEIDPDTHDENGAVLRSQVTFAPIYGQGRRVRHLALEAEMEVGRGLVSGQGSDPQVMLDWSDNGHTWGQELWRSMGKIGEYDKRIRWNRLGSARERTYRLTITDPVDWALQAAHLDIAGGR